MMWTIAPSWVCSGGTGVVYEWSSAAAYALGKPHVLLDMDENAEYVDLASSPSQRQKTWQRFLLGDDRREAAVRRGD
jgi:hypothetical protein